MIDWHRMFEWFQMGFFLGLGYLTVSLLWNMVFNRAPSAPKGL